MSTDLEQRFPDAANRLLRSGALRERLTEFLGSFVESDGGWAQASHADTEQLVEIFQEIIDLKFERDPDGDSVINFDLVNRRYSRLISVSVPNRDAARNDSPYTPLQEAETERDIAAAQTYLLSTANDLSNRLSDNTYRRWKILDTERRIGEALDRLHSAEQTGDHTAVETSVIELCGDYKEPKNSGLLREDDPRRQDVLARYARTNIEDVNATRTDIEKALIALKESSPEDTSLEKSTWKMIHTSHTRFGKDIFADQLEYYEALSTERRADRRKARLSK